MVVEYQSHRERIVIRLIGKQRTLADSHDPLQRAQTLWVATKLNEQLSRCTDREIGNVMSVALERLPMFGCLSPSSQSASTPGGGSYVLGK